MTPEKDDFPPLYGPIRQALEVMGRVWHRLDVQGREHLPPAGQGGVLCCNHDNYSDPFFLAGAIDHRHLRFMGEMQAFDMPVVRDLAKIAGAESVQVAQGRATDAHSVGSTLDRMAGHVKNGSLCAIFPEGQIKHWIGHGDALKDFYTGAVRVAAKAGAPIYPAGMYGTRWVVPNIAAVDVPWMKDQLRVWVPGVVLPSKVCLTFGPPLSIDPAADGDRAVAKAETARLKEAIKDLREASKRRR